MNRRLSLTITPPAGASINLDKWEDLTFSQEVPGGFGYCTFTLRAPIRVPHRALTPWADVTVHDGAEVVFQGRLEKDRRTLANGELISGTAYGWQRHAADDVFRGLFRDTRLDLWLPRYRVATNSKPYMHGGILTVTDDPDERFELKLTPDGDWDTGDFVQIKREIPSTYPQQKIRQVFFKWAANAATTSFKLRVWDGTTVFYQADHTASEQTVDLRDGVAGINFSERKVAIQMIYAPGTGSPTNTRTVYVKELAIVAAGPPNRTASDVVKEVISGSTALTGGHVDPGFCPMFDTGSVQTSGYTITSPLIYPEPVPPQQVFDEMLGLAPTNAGDVGWIWAVWERLPTGLYRFAFEPLPEDVAYQTGPRITDVEVTRDYAETYNRALVHFQSPAGLPKETARTQTIDALAALGSSGITRTIQVGPIEIADDVLGERIGDVLLAENTRPLRQASLQIREGDIIDVSSGAPLPVWRVRAGKRIRIATTRVHDADTSVAADESVFLIRRVEVDARARTATLTLDNPTDTVDHFLARIGRL